MPTCHIVAAFPAFREFWPSIRHKTMDEQIDAWATIYMARRIEGWQDWCQANERWLAAEFMRAADGGESLRPFFGSWHDILGWKQTGHYLGHCAFRRLETNMDLHEIALLDEVEPLLRNELDRLASADG